MKKVVIAGILGGIAMFIWSFIAHMLLPIGGMGISLIPNEEAVLTTMKSEIQQPGFYMIPGFDVNRQYTEAEEQAFTEKYKAGPNAILIYNPQGSEPMSTGQLLRELAFTIVCGLIAAWIMSMSSASLFQKAIAVMLIGAFGWFSISMAHWNWYRFPFNFILGQGLDEIIGWLLAGFVIAFMQRTR